MISTTASEQTRLTLPGVSIGHGCSDCFKLTVEPEYLDGAGARWTGVVTFTAGHAGGPDPQVGSASIDTDDLPELIATLQHFYDQQQQAGESFVPGWPIDL